ncbi:FlgO family outer membrane protein [Methylohalobius crimeensis]|uniref:FlgO family outer membrane protein n=1 Tax=Methylohalobius crimeensis TaxID=244365 RepID=UPI0003B48542|nr:FlgO family outer membrane protein [Methylohalobius crimeensis]
MNSLFFPTVLIGLFLLLGGCNTAPVYEVSESPFGVESIASRSLEKAIIQAGRRSGWRIRKVRQGRMMGEFRTPKNKHVAVVEIDYTPTTFSIRYDHSLNLKYRPAEAGAADATMGLSDLPGVSERKRPTIHKVYNQWVAALESAILTEVKKSRYTVSSNARSSPRPKPSASPCPAPHPESLAGRGVIKVKGANLRSGPGIHCAKVGFLKAGDELAVRGRDGKWLLVEASGDPAWIYAKLVERQSSPPGSENRSAGESQSPPVSKPKATIAVIQFKTLNREAQELKLGDLVSESFTTALVNSRAFKIIERDQLNKVVKEIELSQTGFIDTTHAVEIGKMLNADAIITGSVALLAGQLQMNARIIDIESAYVLSAESRTIPYRLEEINRGVREIVFSLSRKFWDQR